MSRDKQRLLEIMDSLDADYQSGKISEEKYRYFRSKYIAKLNNIEKANQPLRTDVPKSIRNNPLKPKNEEEKLIEKFILNPKKQKRSSKVKSKQSSKPMDSSTFKLALVLVLVIGFTVGIGVGILGFDFGDLSILSVDAVVTDTVFPDVPVVNSTNTTTNITTTTTTNITTTYKNSTPTPTPGSGNGTG